MGRNERVRLVGGNDFEKAREVDLGDREVQSFAKSQLRAFCERIERLEEEKKALADDIREVYGEAKANGFDVKALRAVIRLRAQEPAQRQEHEAILDLYKDAVGIGSR